MPEDLLVDPASFQETSTLAGAARWDDEGQLRSCGLAWDKARPWVKRLFGRLRVGG